MHIREFSLIIFNIVCLFRPFLNFLYNVNQTVFIDKYEKQWSFFNTTILPELDYLISDDITLITDKFDPEIKIYFALITSDLFLKETTYINNRLFSMRKNLCTQRNLLVLTLNNFNFETIPCIIPSNSLRYIDLSYNKIQRIIPSNFNQYTNLRYLDLSHNKIKLIQLEFRFTDSHFSFFFYAAHNNLKEINLFVNQTKIFFYLNVGNNPLIKKEVNEIQKLVIDMGTFNISRNHGYYMELDQHFKISDWKKIKRLASRDYLSIIHESLNLEEHPSYRDINNLQTISLRNNKFKFLRKTRLIPYPRSIRNIYLSHNLIEFIDPAFFDEYINLIKLDLSYNQLYLIKHFELKIKSLSILLLDNNKMNTLEYLVLNSTNDLSNLTINLDANSLSKIPVIKCQVKIINLISVRRQIKNFDTLQFNFNGITNSKQNPVIEKLDLSNNYNLKKINNYIFCSMAKNNLNNLKIQEIHLIDTNIDKEKINCLKHLQIEKSNLKIFYSNIPYVKNGSECRYSEEADCELHAKRIENIMTITTNNKNILDIVLIGLTAVYIVLSVILVKMLCFT